MSQGTNEQATDDLIREAISNNTYSSEKIATSDATELGHVARVADADQTQPGVDQLRANADRAATDEVLNTKLGKNIQQVNRLRGTATTNTTTAPVDIHAQDTEANSDASRYGQ